ncbi:MAG: CopD family protein [Haloarculaceae archaeon]
MPGLVHLAVRFLHVIGMALLLGGAAVTWDRSRRASDPAELLDAAGRYEWLFWTVTGVMVATGVGNLGVSGVADLSTRWGAVLAVKLLAVLGLLGGSVVRTLAVEDSTGAGSDAVVLRRSYAATTLYLAGLLALAEVLAHG